MRRFMGPPRPLRPMIQIPEHVEAAIVRALAKDPAERFATGGAFIDALEGRAARPPSATPAREPALTTAVAGGRRTGKRGCAGVLVLAAAPRGSPRICRSATASPRDTWPPPPSGDSPHCPILTSAGDRLWPPARRKFLIRLHLIGLAAVLALGALVAVLLWRSNAESGDLAPGGLGDAGLPGRAGRWSRW